MTSNKETRRKSLKEVPITDVLPLIDEAKKLALETIKESKHANQSLTVLHGVLAASSAITKADTEMPRVVVDVPIEIKEQLNDIQQRVNSQELTLASIQGMIIAQATLPRQPQQTFVQPSTMQSHRPATAQSYQQHSNSTCQNIFDELVESLNLMFANQR